jgi:hypothetical protein
LAPGAKDDLKVFISYAREDSESLEALRRFLKPLEKPDPETGRRGVRVFADVAIQPSEHWRERIRQEIAAADAAVLLITQDFVASDFVMNEEIPLILDAHRERGMKVFCVAVGVAYGFSAALRELQWIGQPERPVNQLSASQQDEVWRLVAIEVARAAGEQGDGRKDRPEAFSFTAGVPHEVPPPVADFTDRTTDLAALQRAIAASRTIIGIFGAPGIGKTELARRFISEIAGQYPDGQIYIDLKGSNASPVPAREIITHLINRFGSPAPLAFRTEELSKRYRSVMFGKRVLLFLENAGVIEQVSLLTPPLGCLFLVTARSRFYLPGMFAKDLRVFTRRDSERFLLEIEPRIGAYAGEIARLCDYLPFALRTAAGTLSVRRDRNPGDYVRELSTSRAKRGGLIEPVIATSFELLAPEERKQQWCALSCFVDPFPREAVEKIWELPPQECEQVIGSLLTSALLQFDERSERYYLLDLVRAFAQAHLGKDQPYLRRHAVHFLRQLTREKRHPLALLDNLANDVFAAYDYCGQEREQRGLSSVIDVIRESLESDEAAAVKSAYLIARLFKRKSRLAEALALYEKCREVALRLALPSLEGACLRSIGEISWLQGDLAKADDLCTKAICRLSGEEDYDSRKELIFTLHLYSEQCLSGGLLDKCERAAEESLRIRDLIPLAERESLAGLSNGAVKVIAFLLHRSELEQAYRVLLEERGNLFGIDLASTLGQVGCAMTDAGRYAEAEALLQEGLTAYSAIPDWVGASWIERCLGELELKRGNTAKARAHHEQSLQISSTRGLQPYQYHLANEPARIADLMSQLQALSEEVVDSDMNAKRKVVRAVRELEQSLLQIGRTEEANAARLQREQLEASIGKEELPLGPQALADRWGCDALSLAWPGELLRDLSPRRS